MPRDSGFGQIRWRNWKLARDSLWTISSSTLEPIGLAFVAYKLWMVGAMWTGSAKTSRTPCEADAKACLRRQELVQGDTNGVSQSFRTFNRDAACCPLDGAHVGRGDAGLLVDGLLAHVRRLPGFLEVSSEGLKCRRHNDPSGFNWHR